MVFVTHSIEEAVLMGHRVVVLKGRPSSVFEVVEVDLPHPRGRAHAVASRVFPQLREHVWATLMDEARKPPSSEFNVDVKVRAAKNRNEEYRRKTW